MSMLAIVGFERVFSATFLWYLIPVVLIGFFHFAISLIGVLVYVCVSVYLGDLYIHPDDLIVILSGVLVAGKSGTAMHNAAHRNFRWPWLSTLIGELCSIQQLIAYRPWQIAHFFHHRHPDDPAMDPHPPQHDTFLAYMLKMKFCIAMKFDTFYFSTFERNPEIEKTWGLTGLAMLISAQLKVILWYTLLGPKFFLLFFVVSNVTTNIFYAHFNYFSHRPSTTDDRKFDILDLNYGWYRLLNWYLAGCYFHRTHHARPNLFNPRKVPVPV
jgi:fatty acid desaturase